MVMTSSHSSAELTCCICGLADPTCQFLLVVTALTCSHFLEAAAQKNVAASFPSKVMAGKESLHMMLLNWENYLLTCQFRFSKLPRNISDKLPWRNLVFSFIFFQRGALIILTVCLKVNALQQALCDLDPTNSCGLRLQSEFL